ncbi:MAG: VWA domain-containing protein [Arcicella sp.]|jgi:hypothetical protein|nr:VWA domain-containing protein [Arcicella sp.]
MIQRKTSLSENVIAFCRFLREHAFVVGVPEEALALEALSFIPFEDKSNFKNALRTILVKNVQNLPKFDRLFDDYWKELEKALDAKIKDTNKQGRRKQSPQEATFNNLKSWLSGSKSDEEQALAAYSVGQNLHEKDFSTIPDDEMEAVMQVIKEISKSLAASTKRRQQRTNKHQQLDIRNSIRKNMKYGGEFMEICYQKPKKNRLKLVMICDVSKSMDLYSSFLIQFMYAFQSVYKQIETFVFSHTLSRITHDLKNKTFHEALRELASKKTGWSGGTEIGLSLQAFNDHYAFQMLDKQTITLILSDGWDTGNADILAENIQKIQQKSKKTIWLNPLAGHKNYAPTTQGMSVAMPYIDIFASAHNVESLRMVGRFI